MLEEKDLRLCKREMDIMNILWNTDIPLTASEIAAKESTLTINTVQAVLRKLIGKSLIKVANIVYSGTVLCRNYVAAVSSSEYALQHFAFEFRKMNNGVTITSLVSNLLKEEQDKEKAKNDVEELLALLENYKKHVFAKEQQNNA